MLLANELDGWAELSQIIDVGGVGVEGTGEGARLVAGCLVGVVEDVAEGGVCCEQVAVEFPCYGLAVLGEDGGGGFDYRGLLGGECWCHCWCVRERRLWRLVYVRYRWGSKLIVTVRLSVEVALG